MRVRLLLPFSLMVQDKVRVSANGAQGPISVLVLTPESTRNYLYVFCDLDSVLVK
jgi:hypothetical protein